MVIRRYTAGTVYGENRHDGARPVKLVGAEIGQIPVVRAGRVESGIS
jgi:hypothetical protein